MLTQLPSGDWVDLSKVWLVKMISDDGGSSVGRFPPRVILHAAREMSIIVRFESIEDAEKFRDEISAACNRAMTEPHHAAGAGPCRLGGMTMNETTTELDLVLAVLRDGRRSDRYLRRSGDGHLYTTPDREFLTPEGREVPPYVEVPVDFDATEHEEEEWAQQLIDELDDQN